MNKIIATSEKGKGMLKMKQSPELEAKKSDNQKSIETCNFIKNAFCVNGDVSLVKAEKEIKTKHFFVLEDSKRGDFIVAVFPNKKMMDDNNY